METSAKLSPPQSETTLLVQAAESAAAYLRSHWRVVSLIYLISVAPAASFSLFEVSLARSNVSFLVFQQLIFFLSFLAIGRSFILSRIANPPEFNFAILSRVCMVGLGLWFSYTILVLGIASPWPNEIKALAVALIIPALYLNLRYYFFFAPPLLRGPAALTRDLEAAAGLSKGNLRLILQSLVGPAGVQALIWAVVAGFSPDQRHLSVVVLGDFCTGIFFILNSVISLSLALNLAPGSEMGKTSLQHQALKPQDPRDILAAPGWLMACFQPQKGFVMLMLSILVWAGNMMRLAELAPAAQIEVLRAETAPQRVFISLLVEDKNYKFRGFHPIFFRLASDAQTPLAPYPLAVKVNEQQTALQSPLPLSAEKLTLRLEFESSRSPSELAALEDVYLWYRGVKIAKINFEKPSELLSQSNPVGPANATPG
jgi:hypothetical protein